MRNIAELNVEAEVKEDPQKYNFKSWCQSASRLFDQGDEAKSAGDIEKAYILLMRAATILLEVVPKHKQFKDNEFVYKSVRKRLDIYISSLEELRKQLQQRKPILPSPEKSHTSTMIKQASLPSISPNSNNINVSPNNLPTPTHMDTVRNTQPPSLQKIASGAIEQRIGDGTRTLRSPPRSASYRPTSPPSRNSSRDALYNVNSVQKPGSLTQTSISPKELLSMLSSPNPPNILVLDVRTKEEFILGHICWKHGNERNNNELNPITGGVVQIEPLFLENKPAASDLEMFLDSFSLGNDTIKQLFERRREYDCVVFYDSNSKTESELLSNLVYAIYQSEILTGPMKRPLLLEGGFIAWNQLVKDNKLYASHWIEIGEGYGFAAYKVENKVNEVAKPVGTTPQHTSQFSDVNRNVYDYIQKHSAKPQDALPLSTQSSQSQPQYQNQQSYQGYYHTSPQTGSIVAHHLNQHNSQAPVIVPGYNYSQHQNLHNPFGSQAAVVPQQNISIDASLTKPTSLFDPYNGFQYMTRKNSLRSLSRPNSFSDKPQKIMPSTPTSNFPLDNANNLNTMKNNYNTPISYPNLPKPSAPSVQPKVASNSFNNTEPQVAVNIPSSSLNITMTEPPISLTNSTHPPQKYQDLPSQVSYQQQNTIHKPAPPVPTQSLIPPKLEQHNNTSSSNQAFRSAPPPRPYPRLPPAPSVSTGTRSSSPSPSPVTQRYYPPMMPSKAPPSLPAKSINARSTSNLTKLPGSTNMVLGDEQKSIGSGALHSSPTDNISISSMVSGSIGMAGLKNLGNTCFMNSIIQCLSGTVPLSRYFLSGSYRKHLTTQNPLGTKGVITVAFAELVKSLWSEQDPIVTPIKFKSSVDIVAIQFQGNDQHDSQEFLMTLLNGLHEDMNLASLVKQPPSKEDEEENLPEQIASQKAMTKDYQCNWSIIVDMFQGQFKSCTKCMTCGKESTTFTPFMDLSLPIPSHNSQGQAGGPVYIEECLEKFIEIEVLDGDNSWNCPRCKCRRRATKQITISKLPQILLIHFKRFYYQGRFKNKINTYIEFPLSNMDLTSYVPSWLVERQGFGYVYDLYAVSSHTGGLNGGHYTAQVRNGYKESWYNFDDSRVSGISPEQVKTSAAYILFYVRQVPPGARTMNNWWSAGGDSRL